MSFNNIDTSTKDSKNKTVIIHALLDIPCSWLNCG